MCQPKTIPKRRRPQRGGAESGVEGCRLRRLHRQRPGQGGQGSGRGPGHAGAAFPEGPLSLIEYFSTSIDEAMEKKLAATTDLSYPQDSRAHQDRGDDTGSGSWSPHKEAARRAAAMLALPMHAALGAKLMYRTVDAMWRAAGDTSTDFNFYTKRGILAGVYGSVADALVQRHQRGRKARPKPSSTPASRM